MNFEIPTVALQRCDRFVARTMNWLYDHLCCVINYRPVVLCDALQNRDEFPGLQAWSRQAERLTRRVWRRIAGARIFPSDQFRLRQLAPRVLHSHFGYVAVEDFALQQMLGVPWFVGFYGADVYASGRQPEWRERYARLFEKATKVLALGPTMKQQLEQLGCPPRKLMLHPLGVDVQQLPSAVRVLRPGEPLQVLFAGTLREKKGIRYLLEAAVLLKRSRTPFVLNIVGDVMGKPGDSETKAAFFAQVSRLNLGDVVIYQPFLPFDQLVALALRSHVFAAPSITAADGDAEGTPFVLQQMMATGMPAVATIHSDIPYLFGAHQHLLVPERDASAIADRLKRYVDCPDSLATDGVALREQICHSFDVRKCAARLSALYDEVQ